MVGPPGPRRRRRHRAGGARRRHRLDRHGAVLRVGRGGADRRRGHRRPARRRHAAHQVRHGAPAGRDVGDRRLAGRRARRPRRQPRAARHRPRRRPAAPRPRPRRPRRGDRRRRSPSSIAVGKVGHIGLSNHPVELLRRGHAVAPIAVAQHQWSILHHPPTTDAVRSWCDGCRRRASSPGRRWRRGSSPTTSTSTPRNPATCAAACRGRRAGSRATGRRARRGGRPRSLAARARPVVGETTAYPIVGARTPDEAHALASRISSRVTWSSSVSETETEDDQIGRVRPRTPRWRGGGQVPARGMQAAAMAPMCSWLVPQQPPSTRRPGWRVRSSR